MTRIGYTLSCEEFDAPTLVAQAERAEAAGFAFAEIFPLKVRSAALSVSTVANWASNFLVSTFFLTLTGTITIQGTFWLYAGFGVAAVLFFVFRPPETKERSLEEISHEVEGG